MIDFRQIKPFLAMVENSAAVKWNIFLAKTEIQLNVAAMNMIISYAT